LAIVSTGFTRRPLCLPAIGFGLLDHVHSALDVGKKLIIRGLTHRLIRKIFGFLVPDTLANRRSGESNQNESVSVLAKQFDRDFWVFNLHFLLLLFVCLKSTSPRWELSNPHLHERNSLLALIVIALAGNR
jgi:hypothetical protein